MEPMEIARRLKEQFGPEILEITGHAGQVSAIVRRDRIVEMLSWLKRTDRIRLNHLMCLCGIDNRDRMDDALLRFEVAYSLYSITHGHEFRLRAQVPEDDPVIESATPVWRGAEWPERECYDLMGITFANHPDLRRILLPDDWQGHPLRKEYPLKGREEWSGFSDLLHKVEKLRAFDFKPEAGAAAGPEKKKEGRS